MFADRAEVNAEINDNKLGDIYAELDGYALLANMLEKHNESLNENSELVDEIAEAVQDPSLLYDNSKRPEEQLPEFVKKPYDGKDLHLEFLESSEDILDIKLDHPELLELRPDSPIRRRKK